MNILILFATCEGQTRKIAEFVQKEAVSHGHQPRLVDLSEQAVSVSFEDVDSVVLAAPVHERRHPKPFETFVAQSRDQLAGCRTLLLSVGLNVAFPDVSAEAQEYVTEMIMRTGFTPDQVALVAGAVRNQNYDYLDQLVMRLVILRDQDFDPRDGDREFTDWDALAATLSDFFAQ